MSIFLVGALIALVGIAIVGAITWYLYMKARFKTVPSNQALIITGPNIGDPEKEANVYKDSEGRHMRIVRGGGYRMKMFQSSTRVSLQSFQLKIETPTVWTKEGVGIQAEAVATVKVADQLQGIVKYAEQFLGKKQEDIEIEISEVLNTNLRAILSKMSVEDINSDRESFNEQVKEIAQEQLNNMGFLITSLGLSDIKDEEGYLENLGKPQIASVKKKADIAESDAARETAIKQAENTEMTEKETYSRQMSVADSKREKDLKDQRILSETNKAQAEAEAAGELERESRQLEIREKQLAVERQNKENDLRLIQMERENDVKIQKQKDDVRRQQADTDKSVRLSQAEADYEAELKRGQAEAEVIRAKAKAEADGIRLRAEAMDENKDAILAELAIKMLPEFAKAISEPMSNVESIRLLGGSDGEGANGLTNSVISQMASAEEGFSQMTGFDLTKMLQNVSERKQTLNVNQSEDSVEDEVEDAQSNDEETEHQSQDNEDEQSV